MTVSRNAAFKLTTTHHIQLKLGQTFLGFLQLLPTGIEFLLREVIAVFFAEFDAIFELKVGDFSSLPVAGQKITLTTCFDAKLNGTVFRIDSVEQPDGAALRLTVKSLTS